MKSLCQVKLRVVAGLIGLCWVIFWSPESGAASIATTSQKVGFATQLLVTELGKNQLTLVANSIDLYPSNNPVLTLKKIWTDIKGIGLKSIVDPSAWGTGKANDVEVVEFLAQNEEGLLYTGHFILVTLAREQEVPGASRNPQTGKPVSFILEEFPPNLNLRDKLGADAF